MVMTDPIADMLTRIRNANQMKHATVSMPASRLKLEILNVLKNEGYISEYEKIEDGKQGVIKVTLKYAEKTRVIKGIKRISKPGLRVYAGKEELPKVLGVLGTAIISTSRGLMTDKEEKQVFHGSAKEAISILPTKVNVAIAASLASSGPENVDMSIFSVPEMVGDDHKITAQIPGVKADLDIYSSTSAIAGWSVVAVLRNLVSPIVF